MDKGRVKLCDGIVCLVFLIVIFISSLSGVHGIYSVETRASGPNRFEVNAGEINTEYVKSIRKEEHHVFQFKLNESTESISDPLNANLKVYANVEAKYDSLTQKCPLHFTIRQRQDVKAWELPVFPENSTTTSKIIYRNIERTLCFNAGDIINEDDLIVIISTCSHQPFEYSFRVEVTYDVFIPLEFQVNKSVALFSPTFYRFQYPRDNSDSPVIVTASSVDDDKTCMILSIQSPTCPVLDTESTVRYTGHWQTVSTKAGITVPREFFKDGFFIVLVILSDDSACEEYNGIVPPTVRRNYWRLLANGASNRSSPRNKTISLLIRSVMDESKYMYPVLLPLGFYFGLILAVFLIFVSFHRLKLQPPSAKKGKVKLKMSVTTIMPQGDVEQIVTTRETWKSRFRATVYISDFVKADYKSLQKKSKQYFWSVTTVAFFYCVPVAQLIFNYVKVLYRTGEHDLCYYNFLCAHPYKNIMDFNHLYSNVGYVLLGFTFMFFVRLRHESLKETSQLTREQIERSLAHRYKLKSTVFCWRNIFPATEEKLDHGVLQHFGLFYAMGVALVMEGALSASYHLCPTAANFQYDTSFMYVIAVLCIVKVYQFRHPVNVNANILIVILALVSIYTTIGLLFENLICKIIFTVLYAVLVSCILTYLYYVGYLKNQYDEVVTNLADVYKYVYFKWVDDLKNSSCRFWSHRDKSWTLETDSNIIQLKLGPNRLLLPVLSLLANGVIIAMIWTIMVESNFATQVLALLIVNLVVYTFYYTIMKKVHDEYEGKVWLQTLIYGFLSVALWVLSLNYFRQAATSWEKSPAESKTHNADCTFLMYDNHDLWHFLSAGAMFCSFMVLLTLDDDLIFTPQNKIPVF